MLRAAAGLLLAGTVVALSSCGSCSSSSDQGAPGGDAAAGSAPGVDLTPSASKACLTYATAFCGRLDACAPFFLQASYGDVVTCAQRAAKGCMPALSAGGSQVTPSQMETCAAAIEAQSCDEALDNQQPSACDVRGALPLLSACGVGSQCASGYCRLTSGLCGICAEHVGATAACLVDADCSATLVCNLGACVGPSVAGAPCGPTAPCMRTLTCRDAKCQTPVSVGGTCTAPTDCDGAHGAFCNAKTQTCAQTQLVPTGHPCGLVGGEVVGCAGGESCGNLTAAGQGTCHPTAVDGAPCGPDIACIPPAVCTATARCTLPNPAVCH